MCCADWAPIQEISVSKSKKSEKVVSLIAAVIDESGSMAGVRTDTIGGYNTFIEKIRDEQAGKKAYVSTFLFDSSHTRPLVRTLQSGVDINAATPLSTANYNPLGGTPLYDAIGLSVASIEKTVKDLGITKVTLLIQTDGEENSSREYRLGAIQALLKQKQEAGWQVIFLGADLSNAVDIGVNLGVSAVNSMAYAKHNTAETFQAMAASTATYRSCVGSSAEVTLSAQEKAKLAS